MNTEALLTTSSSIPDTPDIDAVYLVVVTAVTLIAFFGNLGTISAFVTDTKVNAKPSDLMLLNLACVDFTMSILVMPVELVLATALGRWSLGEIGCRIIVPINMTLLTAGIMSVILISFDRYQMLALDYSKYVKKWSEKPVKRLIAITWIISLLPGVFETVTWDITIESLAHEFRPNFKAVCSQPSSWRVFTNVVCVIFVAIIPTIIVSTLGILIIFKLHHRLRQWRRVGYNDTASTAGSTAKTVTHTLSNVGEENLTNGQKHNNATTDTDNKNGNKHTDKSNPKDLIRKRYIKPIVTYISLTMCVAICTFPLCIYALLLSTDFKFFNPVLLKYLLCLMYSASCWNPILYGLTNSKIRDFYKKRVKAVVRTFRAT